MNDLVEQLNESMMMTLTRYSQKYIDDHWLSIWEENFPELEQMFQSMGDSAYGIFCSKLFRPLEGEIYGAGIIPKPLLPGSFPQSEELWGPWEERERRFWSVIQFDNGKPIGTLITRFFHDHTTFRLPRAPQLYAVAYTDLADIKKLVIHSDPEEWGTVGWRDREHA